MTASMDPRLLANAIRFLSIDAIERVGKDTLVRHWAQPRRRPRFSRDI